MGRRCFVMILLFAGFLSSSFSQGYGRRVKVVRHYGNWHSNQQPVQQQQQHHLNEEKKPEPEAEAKAEKVGAVGRQTVEATTNYKDPKANTNSRNGTIFDPPPSPPAPSELKH